MERGAVKYRNSRRLGQLTGDVDMSHDQHFGPTLGQSSTKYDVMGTDLGISVDLGDRIYFFFGDTLRKNGSTNDCIGYTDADIDPDETLPTLRWITGGDPAVPRPFKPLTIHGYDDDPHSAAYGDFYVASGAFADPANGTAYLVFGLLKERSILAKASALNPTSFEFDQLYELSHDKFATAATVVVGDEVYIFGTSKSYRKSKVYLARSAMKDVGSAASWRYFTKRRDDGTPEWASHEADAGALFDLDPEVDLDGIGELSVAFHASTGLWLMTYHSVRLRYATSPWGPWFPVDADPRGIIFDLDDHLDGGFGVFAHVDPLYANGQDDELWGFPDFPRNKYAQWFPDFWPERSGASYAPYLIPRWFKSDDTSLTIFYTASSWNPYQVHLMRTTLDIECR